MTTTIDPRIRERRIEVKREAGRKRLRVVLGAIVAFVVIGTGYLTVESPLLDVDHIRVTGVQHLDAAAVERAAGVQPGAPLLRADTRAVAARIEALPWVASAKVSRALPATLRITVTERVPVAWVRRDDAHVVLLAADGTAIVDTDAPPAGLVEIRGARRIPATGARLTPARAAGAAAAMPPELAARVVAVDVTADATTLVLGGGAEVRLCTATDLAAKGAAAVAVMQQLGDRSFSYVDVCVPQSPVSK
jgi:cell division protein FtsQ